MLHSPNVSSLSIEHNMIPLFFPKTFEGKTMTHGYTFFFSGGFYEYSVGKKVNNLSERQKTLALARYLHWYNHIALFFVLSRLKTILDCPLVRGSSYNSGRINLGIYTIF